MRLNVALVNGLCAELPLYDDVRLLETLFDVAQTMLEVLADVGAAGAVIARAAGPRGLRHCNKPLVQERGVLLHGLPGAEHRREHLVVHLNEGKSLFCNVKAGGGYGGHGVPLVQRLLIGQAVPAHKPYVPDLPLANVGRFIGDLHKVLGGHHSLYARQLHRLARVYGLDPGVRMGAPENLAIEKSGEVDVGSVAGATRDLVQTVVANGPGANHVVFLVRKNDVRLVIQHNSS